jgi:2,4-dienoyl-CoA reductase-like NADH-dependent reductase (Old Yellow Enzyme family)
MAKLKTSELFLDHVRTLGVDLPFDAELQVGNSSPLGRGLTTARHKIGNRFCILPMEGWDGTTDGRPTELTRRRWQRFGQSGAKLIWGGEAVAVRPDGRANPNQLMINESTVGEMEGLLAGLIDAHQDVFGKTDDLSVGLQLTHSGRFARPNAKDKLEPRTAYEHPILDNRFGVNPELAVLSDDELKQLIEDFVAAAKLAQVAGFQWVDIKHCHGYLGHELLSGFDREGLFGGTFENRTRFIREVVGGVRTEAPGLEMGVRLSVFDFYPFQPGADRVGQPSSTGDYQFAFGGDGSGLGISLEEPIAFVKLLGELGIELLCTTAGSPYYNPHIQRPAVFPPSDGYLPPEDPLVGVARQIAATQKIKSACPGSIIVGSGYSYLQDWLPNVGQAAVANSATDLIGLGRMVLSYPDLPADVLAGRELQRKKICRTFSDCTTAPRNGMVSGCFPLDEFYKQREEYRQLIQLKKSAGDST